MEDLAMGMGLSVFTTFLVSIFAGSVWIANLHETDIFKDDSGKIYAGSQTTLAPASDDKTW